MRNLRRISQGLFLALFIFLLLATRYGGTDQIRYPVKVFLDFDPLIFLSTFLAAHALPPGLLWSLIIILVTVFLGRIFCGWICPLGTLNHLVGSLGKKLSLADQGERFQRWQPLKYYFLIALLVSSLFTLQLVGWFDPLSLLIRSFAISVDPALNWLSHSMLHVLSRSGLPPLEDFAEGLRNWSLDTFLSSELPHFHQAEIIGIIFLGILALNLLSNRFWCVAFCPLGALLGILSRFSLTRLKVSDACNGCRVCNRSCQTIASPYPPSSWKGTECIYCWNCEDLCPTDAAQFQILGAHGTRPVLNLERRALLGSMIGGTLAVPLLKSGSSATLPPPKLIRPPGALPEREFLQRCIRCGECMKVCPTHGLQPTFLQAGWEGLWSPILIPRIGYCEYACTLCGQVCPTGAIRNLSPEVKQKVCIGLAFIDRDRCLPYNNGIPCIVCEEHCPTPQKAIWLEEGWVKRQRGKVQRIQLPRVDFNLCIGCGICEKRCPVVDLPAIRVTRIGESRDPQQRIFLLPGGEKLQDKD